MPADSPIPIHEYRSGSPLLPTDRGAAPALTTAPPSTIQTRVIDTVAELLLSIPRYVVIHPDVSLEDDLGLDAIDAVDLECLLEERFGRTFSDGIVTEARTIADLIHNVAREVHHA
jgi:acyl carrier protein